MKGNHVAGTAGLVASCLPPGVSDHTTRYFMRYIAGLATTVTSKSLIKEKASKMKKPIKKINKTIMLILKKNVGSSRLLVEVTGKFIRSRFGLNGISVMLFLLQKW